MKKKRNRKVYLELFQNIVPEYVSNFLEENPWYKEFFNTELMITPKASWYWRLISRNGKILSIGGEGFCSKSSARNSFWNQIDIICGIYSDAIHSYSNVIEREESKYRMKKRMSMFVYSISNKEKLK